MSVDSRAGVGCMRQGCHCVARACSILVLLEVWPGLDIGTVFDGKRPVLGGVKINHPVESTVVHLLILGSWIQPSHFCLCAQRARGYQSSYCWASGAWA